MNSFTLVRRHYLQNQVLGSVLTHRSTTSHRVHQCVSPRWSIQLLRCTLDLSPQICFLCNSYLTYQAMTWVCCRRHAVSPSLCWQQGGELLCLSRCAQQFNFTAVSDESWGTLRREGTVIERQRSSSCVLFCLHLFYVHISYICMWISVCTLKRHCRHCCSNSFLFVYLFFFWMLHVVIHKLIYSKHLLTRCSPSLCSCFGRQQKAVPDLSKNLFWSLRCFDSKPFTLINNWIYLCDSIKHNFSYMKEVKFAWKSTLLSQWLFTFQIEVFLQD